MKMMLKATISLLCLLVAVSCVALPPLPEPPPEAVKLPFGYDTAFEKILDTLEKNGYAILLADPNRGIIQTKPKAIERETGDKGIAYRGAFFIQVWGTDGKSWAIIEFALLPHLPSEKDRLIHLLTEEKKP